MDLISVGSYILFNTHSVMSKKSKEQFIRLAPPDIKVVQTSILTTIRSSDEPGWQINQDLFIINMNANANCTRDLIMGDRIIKINGKTPRSSSDAMSALMPGVGDIRMIVERRQHITIVPPDRIKKIGVQRMEGFAYFLVTCVNDRKGAKATLGFTLSLLKNKAHIITVESGSIASQHFAIGDALLDIDGEKIPFAGLNFLKNYSNKFFKQGQFTTVVERPTTPARIDQYIMVYKTMLPQSDAEVEMGADAIKIGMEAASMHNLVFRKIKPKSCLTSDLTSITATRTQGQTIDEGEKKVKMASSSVVSVIGSDADDEDDLRKVERKSHSKEQMNLDDL